VKSKVLVTSASRHRATQEIAEAIASALRERGIAAEARGVEEVHDLRDYGAVVLGSAVYMNRWLGPARRFALVHTSELTRMPVWLFSSGPLGPPGHEIPPGVSADVPVLLRLTQASGHRRFGGRLAMKDLHFSERALARSIHAPEGDSRDWDAIDRFAGEIADELFGAHLAACG
jgi:menaquinone-dependent protoporphyrinogen oxidase